MIKNLIIIFLIYIIGSLVIGKPDNVEILKNTLSATKEYFSKGVGNVENKLKEADPEESIAGHANDFFSEKKTLTEDSFFKEDSFLKEKTEDISK